MADHYNGDGKTSSRRSRPKKSSAAPIIISIAVAALAVLIGVACYYVYGYDKVYAGVHGLEQDLSGMTQEDARRALQRVSDDFYKDKNVVMTVEGTKGVTITAAEAGISTDVSIGAVKAMEYGRVGNFFDRLGAIFNGFGGKGVELDIPTKYDVSIVPAKVDELAALVESDATTPEYEIKNNRVVIDLGSSGARLDKRKIVTDVSDMLSNSRFGEYPAELVTLTPENLDIDAIYNEVHTEMKNAALAIDGKSYDITPETEGRSFDLDAAKAELKKGEGRVYDFDIVVTKPGITQADLKAKLFRDLLGESTTNLNTKDVNRTTNVKIATEAVNGTIINVGGNFSYNDVVGPRTVERGYANAKIFASGEVVDGIGGGICQLSSTIYMSALLSNMEQVTRYNHRFAVSYTPLGQDATVAWGSLDYVFKNNSEYPIKIVAVLDGGNLTVKIYGTKTDDYTYKLKSTTLSSKPPETKETFVKTLEPGVSKTVQKGHDGYSSETYRIVYQNGEEIRRDFVNKSSYKPQPQLVETGATFGEDGKPILDAAGRPVVPPPVVPPTPPVTPPTEPVVPPTEPVAPPTEPVAPPAEPEKPVTPPVTPPTDDTVVLPEA